MARAEAAGDAQLRDARRPEFKAREAEARAVRGEALALVRETTGDAAYSDVNYVFPDVHHHAHADRRCRAC